MWPIGLIFAMFLWIYRREIAAWFDDDDWIC